MLFNIQTLNKTLLLILFVTGYFPSLQAREDESVRINNLLDRIERENRIVEEITAKNLTNLPVGLQKTISNNTITIAIDSARITPAGMLIDAYTRVLLPGTEKYIQFTLRNALITPSGLSQAGPTRLELATNCQININDKVTMVLLPDGSNYVDWDCYGFRSVSLSGVFEFSPEVFVPDDPGNPGVTAQFAINTSDLNNILVETSITPFRIKGLSDMAFCVDRAVIDMSDYVNCDGFAYPSGYPVVFNDMPELWRGFFLKNLTIKLPSELGSSGKRTEISAANLLIDDFGLSGYFAAENVLRVGQGNASGWPFSIEAFELGIVQNRITSGKMKGILGVPFLGNEPLDYYAAITSGRDGPDYSFNVIINEEKEFPVPFGGTVRLGSGCIFSISSLNGRFMPSAYLNGSLFLSAEPAKLDGLRFEKLELLAESPYIKGGVFDVGSGINCSLAGFALSFDSISLGFRNGRALMTMNTRVALMNKEDKGIGASTRFMLNASVRRDPSNEEHTWSFDGLVLEDLDISGNVSLFSLTGQISIFNDHPVYGDAFIGKVKFSAGELISNPAVADVTFGNKEDFRYWYAKLNIPTDIPLGIVTLTYISGGAFNNMTRTDLLDPESDYMPKKDAGMGFLAGTGFYVKTKKIFNADALFEIAINRTGGLKYVMFTGEGRFFNPDEEENTLVKTSASVLMAYDNTNRCFHANLNVYMNIANAIRGVGPGDMLGEAVIHVDPQDWYVYIGRPSLPLGVEVLGLLRAQTYFMAGTKIEQMPLPPSEVAALMTNINTDFMQGERGIATGRGIAFGVMFKASAGIGQNGGFVYAYFSAGAGADIMLQDYGEAYCEGRSGPIGINGWYASGQGYAFLTGKLGIRVKKHEFDIMNVAAALLVQAKMPNPAWFRGAIAARYSVLGGLVKGKVNVTVVLGEECVLVTNGNELGDLQLIGDISPSMDDQNVDVFAAPQVSFNTTIDKEFGMMNILDEYAVYRVRMDEFKLLTANSEALPGTIQWNPSHDMATLKLNDILPGLQQLTASIKVHIEKKTGTGWVALSGDPETKASKFNTGAEPNSIPESNVAYSYPLRNQYNFYRSEYPTGYITLNSGQPRLFEERKDGVPWQVLAKLSTNGRSFVTPVTYNEAQKTVYFNIPHELVNSTEYDLSIIRRPATAAQDANLKRSSVEISMPGTGDSLTLAKTEITEIVVAEADIEIHSLAFRTSKYSTFNEKIKTISNWRDQMNYDENGTYMKRLYVRATLNETFDKYETEGSGPVVKPLVAVEARRGNGWIDSHVYPLIYELYGTGNLTLDRDPEILGLFPARGMYVSNSGSQTYLLNQNISNTSGDVFIMYNIPPYVFIDFLDLQRKAAQKYINTKIPVTVQAQRLLAGTLYNLYSGSYPFTLSYRLPGTNIITSSANYDIKY